MLKSVKSSSDGQYLGNIWVKAISILAGNLNSGLSYFITTVRTSWIWMRIMQRCIHQFSSRSTFVHRQILLCGPPFEAAEAVPAAPHVLVLADFGSAGFFIRGAEAAAAAVNSKILVLLLKTKFLKNLKKKSFSNFSCMFLNPNIFFQFEFELF